MYFADAETPASVVAAMDINPVANQVYAHNHPETRVCSRNIDNLTADALNQLRIEVILMSPPCQPHTRVGRRRDVQDNRSAALNRICSILKDCHTLQYLLMENVKGFEASQARNDYISALTTSGYHYREFVLSPSILGVPNTRHRYYCLARRPKDFWFEAGGLWRQLPGDKGVASPIPADISTILEDLPEEEEERKYLLDDKTLERRVLLLDIVRSNDTNTMCFTKAYTRYAEGTGSVLCACEYAHMQKVFARIKAHNTSNSEELLPLLKSLRLRYFTPREVARLMCFPETFSFPPSVSEASKYRLLGNSINVRVVAKLIKLLIE